MKTIALDTRPLAERITQGTFRVEGGKILYGPTILDPRPMGGTVTGCVAIIQGSALRNYSDNASLVVEAFNVTHETKRTPRQLADERAELIECLKLLMGNVKREVIVADPHRLTEARNTIAHIEATLTRIQQNN